MSVYCYICCDYCGQHGACKMRDGGCERCNYWRRGECSNRAKADEQIPRAPNKF